LKELLKNIYAIILVLIFWFVFHLTVNSSIIPSPLVTVNYFFMNFFNVILPHLIYSSFRIFVAIFVSLLVGLPVGILMGMTNKGDMILSPLVYLAYPIPKIAFLPVFMVLFGLGDLSKIILIFTIIVFQIIIGARDGIKEIPDEIHISAKSLGLGLKEKIIHVIWPALLPKTLTSLRISSGIAISALFLSENYATRFGIGYFIMNNWIMVDYVAMFSGIIALSALGFLVFKIIDFGEKLLCPWNKVKD